MLFESVQSERVGLIKPAIRAKTRITLELLGSSYLVLPINTGIPKQYTQVTQE